MSSEYYIVRFGGNSSRKWDGKEILLDKGVLDELYDSTELFDGAQLVVPFKGKGGKITHWNAVFVTPEKAVKPTATSESQAQTSETPPATNKPTSTPAKNKSAAKNPAASKNKGIRTFCDFG